MKITNIIEDTDPVHKASVLAKIDMAMELGKTNKSADEIIDILKSEPETKMATGGRAGYYGGGQAMVEPDLSDIGHGSDALMGRTRLTAPGSQATTSTGLNYSLGEDNDNVRVPFKDGLGVEVPPAKPYTPDMFEKDSMTLLQGMYGTGKDSNKFLYNEMIKKGNILRNQGVERETVIEIIRNNKDKINAFLETQTTTPKSLAGLADGGRAAFGGGGTMGASDKGYQGGGRDKEGNVSGTAPGAAAVGGVDDRGTPEQNQTQMLVNAGYTPKQINEITNPSVLGKVKNSPFKILLSHDPTHWREEVIKKTGISLTLSGHTHGMQVGFQYKKMKWSPIKYKYKHWAGLYNENEKYPVLNYIYPGPQSGSVGNYGFRPVWRDFQAS